MANRRILVVDDERAVRDLLRRCLESDGYEVTEAAGGQEAMAAIQNGGIDLVRLDINLGGQSGLDVAQAVRDRRWRCVEVTAAALQRIDAVDGELHAFCTLAADAAMAQAESLDARLAAGQDIGALGGVPVAIKDLMCMPR